MGEKWITVKSKNEAEARQQAKKKLQETLETEIKDSDLKIRREKAGMRDRLKGLQVFRAGLQDIVPENVEVNLDGHFKVRFNDEGIMLRVHAPKGSGKPVGLEEVKKAAEKRELQDVDWEKVETYLRYQAQPQPESVEEGTLKTGEQAVQQEENGADSGLSEDEETLQKTVEKEEVEKEEEDKEEIAADEEKEDTVEEESAEVSEDIKKMKNQDWVVIAERRPELDRDAEVEISLADDGQKAFLDYRPPLGGAHISREQLEQKLQEEGIVHGILAEELEKIPGAPAPLDNFLIARGTDPVQGKDGFLEYHFRKEEREFKGQLREDGSVDHYELDLINNVQKGDPVITLKPPVPGKPGKTVTGKEIAPDKNKEAVLPRGKNVEVSEDGQQLLAGLDGQVIEEGPGRISVLPVHQVRGDVDLSTGNIKFLGAVIVDGNVTDGFKVEAEGEVEVRGSVSGGTIISRGRVLIRKGYVGKGKGQIKSGEDVQVKFVENGNIEARGDVIIGDAIMHSQVSTGGKIVVKGRGLISGGSIMAGLNVEASVIGSSLATRTEVIVGVDPEIREKYQQKLKDSQELSDNLNKIKKAVSLLEKAAEKNLLSEERQEQLQQLLQTRAHLEKELKRVEQEKEDLQEKIMTSRQGSVKVHQTLHPGVTIDIAGTRHKVPEKRGRTMLVLSGGDIAYRTL